MATHSSVLAWRIPGKGGAWQADVYGVAQSRTRLKRLSSSSGKEPVHQHRRCKRLGFDPWAGKNPLEQEMVTHSSILAWRIPRTEEEPGRLQSMGSQELDMTQLLNYYCYVYYFWHRFMYLPNSDIELFNPSKGTPSSYSSVFTQINLSWGNHRSVFHLDIIAMQ